MMLAAACVCVYCFIEFFLAFWRIIRLVLRFLTRIEFISFLLFYHGVLRWFSANAKFVVIMNIADFHGRQQCCRQQYNKTGRQLECHSTLGCSLIWRWRAPAPYKQAARNVAMDKIAELADEKKTYYHRRFGGHYNECIAFVIGEREIVSVDLFNGLYILNYCL